MRKPSKKQQIIDPVNARIVAKRLMRVRNEDFDIEETICGTVGCVAGHTVMALAPGRIPSLYVWGGGEMPVVSWERLRLIAAELLKVPAKVQRTLFAGNWEALADAYDLPDDTLWYAVNRARDRQTAARMLRALADAEERRVANNRIG